LRNIYKKRTKRTNVIAWGRGGVRTNQPNPWLRACHLCQRGCWSEDQGC